MIVAADLGAVAATTHFLLFLRNDAPKLGAYTKRQLAA